MRNNNHGVYVVTNDAVDEIEFDLGDDTTDPGKLRKSFEKQLKDKVAALKAVQDELATLKTQARTATLRDTFVSLVGDDKAGIAEFYQGEPDEAAVKDWLKTKGALFGVTLEDAPPPQGDANRLAIQRVAAAASGASRSGGLAEAEAALRAVTGNPYEAMNAILGNNVPQE